MAARSDCSSRPTAFAADRGADARSTKARDSAEVMSAMTAGIGEVELGAESVKSRSVNLREPLKQAFGLRAVRQSGGERVLQVSLLLRSAAFDSDQSRGEFHFGLARLERNRLGHPGVSGNRRCAFTLGDRRAECRFGAGLMV